MDNNGLQKKILELSKNAAQLQVSIPKPREIKNSGFYLVLVEGEFLLLEGKQP